MGRRNTTTLPLCVSASASSATASTSAAARHSHLFSHSHSHSHSHSASAPPPSHLHPLSQPHAHASGDSLQPPVIAPSNSSASSSSSPNPVAPPLGHFHYSHCSPCAAYHHAHHAILPNASPTSLRVTFLFFLVAALLAANLAFSYLPSSTLRLTAAAASSSSSTPSSASALASVSMSASPSASMPHEMRKHTKQPPPEKQQPPSSLLSQHAKTQQNSTRSEANIAFFLQIAEATLPLLPRLLRALYHPGNVYALHFDAKIPAATRDAAVANLPFANESNVLFMHPEVITYRGVSMLLNTLSAMQLLVDHDENRREQLEREGVAGADGEHAWEWNFFINLSGADYPLLNAQAVRQLLGAHVGQPLNFFSFADRVTWKAMAENRLSQLWYDNALAFGDEEAAQMDAAKASDRQIAAVTRKDAKGDAGKDKREIELLKAKNPFVQHNAMEICHAEAWMINSKQFIQHVLKADVARKLLVSFAYSADASEHYFATLAWNDASIKTTIVPHSLRKIIWSYKGVMAGQHPFLIDDKLSIPNNSTNATSTAVRSGGTARDADTPALDSYKFKEEIESSVLLFARKFSVPDSPLMDWIDRRSYDEAVVRAARDHLALKVDGRQRRLDRL